MAQQHQIPQPTLPDPDKPKRSRLTVVALALLGLLAVGVIGIGVMYATGTPGRPKPPPPPATVTIQGDITVPSSLDSQGVKGGDCVSDNGYTDIAAGAQVTITNQAGAVIHTGALGDGHTADVVPDLNGGDDIPFHCTYHFLIEGVPGDATNYGVSVGNTFRGTLHFTREQLAEPITLNLG